MKKNKAHERKSSRKTFVTRSLLRHLRLGVKIYSKLNVRGRKGRVNLPAVVVRRMKDYNN
jgi:hypothetical protein